jgi:hypothetical protein
MFAVVPEAVVLWRDPVPVDSNPISPHFPPPWVRIMLDSRMLGASTSSQAESTFLQSCACPSQ